MRSGLITIFTVAWAACTSEPAQAPDPKNSAAADVKPLPGPATVEELLAQPPPPLGPLGQLTERIAQHYQVGLFRCPIPGVGRVTQKFGTERDLLTQNGPIWEMEIDPATAPVWDPLFDEIASEDRWVTGLAMPGATRSWVRGRGDTTHEFEHPPAAAGTTVICTSSKPLARRVVKGKVKEVPGKPFNFDAIVARCADVSDEPIYIAKDGSYEMETRVPCTIWAERPGYRSEKVRVEAGNEPLVVDFELEPDPLQLPEGGWTPEGKAQAEATLAKVKERWEQAGSLLEKLKSDTDKASPAGQRLASFSREHELFGYRITRAKTWLDAPPEKVKAKAKAPDPAQPGLGLGGAPHP